MRVVIPLLVLLFSMSEVQTESTQTEVQTESQSTGAAAAAAAVVTTQLDISTELRELRDMVVEQRVLLTVTRNELQKMESENAALKTEVINLKMENAAQETRLSATETDMEHVKKDTAAKHTELTTMKTEVMNLIKETTAELTVVKTRLAATETDVVNLEKEITNQPKVAFSAGLGGNIESGSTELNLVFTKIITSVGQAYNSTTGFFTAPVRGVYYFRFTVMDYLSSSYMNIRMYKNGEEIIYLYDYDTDGHPSYLSGGATLQLEEGDVVNLRLTAGKRLYGDTNVNIFSGFLLFPL